LLNGIGAAVWAAALGAAAYKFGAVLEGLLGNVKKYELWVLGALLVIGGLLWIRRRIKSARIAREAKLAAVPATVDVKNRPDE
jgi:membrane protein DedA with SNARE-associated domain